MTSETKWTPGPWNRNGLTISKHGRGIIAKCPTPQSGGVFECSFNARLITAAPVMATDGQFLLDRLDELEIPENLAREWFGHVEPAIERFRAALRAADEKD